MREEIKLTQSELVGQLCAAVVIPVAVVVIAASYALHGIEFFVGIDNIWTILACVASLLTLMPHEMMHYLGWKVSTGRGRDMFTIKFKGILGASIEFHGNMPVKDFMVGLILPTILTSIVPCVLGVVCGSFALVLYGLMMTMGCGSDIVIYFRLLKYRSWNCYDPGNTGVVVYKD